MRDRLDRGICRIPDRNVIVENDLMESVAKSMKKNLTLKETIFVASMLFGMFFGAGNLIFPASMGQLAGERMWLAAVGFLITGVGLPLLGVAALGISRKDGLLEVSSQVGKRYGICFTSVLYLTIGPFFAIPRCATVAFSVGVEQMFPENDHTMALVVFSVLFFAVVLFFSLRPGKILVWIGKILNPLFLCFLAILIVRALLSPMGAIGELEPTGAYETQAFFTGVLEGYNTMDALAGLAFGIIVVQVVRGLGVEESGDVAKNTVKAGVFSSILMAVIYLFGDRSGGTEPGSERDLGKRRNCAGTDRGTLFWKSRSADPCGHGHIGMSENGGRLDYKPRRNL